MNHFDELKYLVTDVSAYLRVAMERLPVPGLSSTAGSWDENWLNVQERFLGRLHPKTMELRVAAVKQETPSTKTLVFRRTDGETPVFRAGQYLSLIVTADGVRTSRPYSISSAPADPNIEITVKALPGEWIPNYLCNGLKLHDRILSTGPKGHFHYEPLSDGKDLVFLAGGSGITPFRSIIRDLAAKNFDGTVELLYANRSAEDVIFASELKYLEESLSWLKVHHVFSDPIGKKPGRFLTSRVIARTIDLSIDRTFYVCGPRALYETALNSLSELGVRPARIRREVFGPPKAVSTLAGWPEGLDPKAVFKVKVNRGATIEAPAGTPLLASLERRSYHVPAVCRTGACGACRVRLLKGNVFIPPGVSIREADIMNNYIHSCTAYPTSDLELEY